MMGIDDMHDFGANDRYWQLVSLYRQIKCHLLKSRAVDPLLPLQDVRLLDDGETWESTGSDPQFSIVGPWPTGWTTITAEIETAAVENGCLRLYVDRGGGYSEEEAYALGAVNEELVC